MSTSQFVACAALAERMAQLGVWVSVPGGRESQFGHHFMIVPMAGTSVASIRARLDDMRAVVGSPHARLDMDGGRLELVVPRVKSGRSPDFGALIGALKDRNEDAGDRAGLASGVGSDSDGRPVFVNLAGDGACHILIAGMTGSGKTHLARALLLGLVQTQSPQNLQLLVIDPKLRSGSGFAVACRRHMAGDIAVSLAEAEAAIGRAAAVMDSRRDGQVLPRLVVYVDELADLCQQSPAALAALTRIAMRGRGVGVHLVLCTQYPSSKAISGELKANLPLRLVGRVGTVEDAKVAGGRSGLGAEGLPGRGSFIAVAGSRVVRFQSPSLPSLPDEPDLVSAPAVAQDRAVCADDVWRWLCDPGRTAGASGAANVMVARWLMAHNQQITDNAVSMAVYGAPAAGNRYDVLRSIRRQLESSTPPTPPAIGVVGRLAEG